MKKCFVIAPIKEENSHSRKKIDHLYDEVFSQVFTDYKIDIAHRISKIGIITSQVIKQIYEADLIIADITDVNGNVMYELGIADTLQKPVIIICENTTNIPFDKGNQRIIMYDYFPHAIASLKEALKKSAITTVSQFLEDTENEVTLAIGTEYLLKNKSIHNVLQNTLEDLNIGKEKKSAVLKTFDNNLREVNSFDKNSYGASVEKLLVEKTELFGRPIISKTKNKVEGGIIFDYFIKTENDSFYIKVMRSINRADWGSTAKSINALKSSVPNLIKPNTYIVFIIPVVRTSGKQTQGISLLKFDSKKGDINNYDVVAQDLFSIKASDS